MEDSLSFIGSLICFYISLVVGVYLTIRRPPKQIFDVGDDVILTCNVSDNSPFENPEWLDQFDANIEEGRLPHSDCFTRV